MQTVACMLCKETGTDFINITYKNKQHSPKDFMLEICGLAVEHYLDNEEWVCKGCMRILNNAVRLKRRVHDIIVDQGINRQMEGKAGPMALNGLDLVGVADELDEYDYDYDDPMLNNNVVSPPSPSPPIDSALSPHLFGATSPNELLMIRSSIPFDQRSEIDMEEVHNKYRYYERTTPMLDREVRNVNYRKKKRKARSRMWTRPKGFRRTKSMSRSRASTPNSRSSRYNRTQSAVSTGTTASRKHKIHTQTSHNARILSDFLYQDDSLSRFAHNFLLRNDTDAGDDVCEYDYLKYGAGDAVIKTRYASTLRDQLLAEYQEKIYECHVVTCQKILTSLEEFTSHMVKEHNKMAWFRCELCRFDYLAQEDLDKHKESHNQPFVLYCIYCSEEFHNKKLYEKHIDDHLTLSFPCIYCDKFFLTKQLCENHTRIEHPGKKKRIKRTKPQTIMERIDKEPNCTNDISDKNSRNYGEYKVRVLPQFGRTDDFQTNDPENLLITNLLENNSDSDL